MNYFVTYKKLGDANEVETSDYDIIIHVLKLKGHIKTYSFERDSDGKIHFHALYYMPKNSYIKNFTIYGYHMDFRFLETSEDIQNVVRYIHKDQHKD
jgi:hypothetical protein